MIEELDEAMQTLKSNKALEVDNVQAELLVIKSGEEAFNRHIISWSMWFENLEENFDTVPDGSYT